MHARFFAPDAHVSGDVVSLPDDEAEHLTRVLRLTRGDAIVVFNGRGLAFEATVHRARKGGAEVLIGRPSTAAPEARVAITLVRPCSRATRWTTSCAMR